MASSSYVHYSDLVRKRFQYGSDLALYTERFADGRLLCAAYQDNGVTVYEQNEFSDKPSFDLVIDGESLYFGWEFVDFAVSEDGSGHACGTLTLRHSRKPVRLKMTTLCCGHGFFRRSMEITNVSDDAVLGLTSAVPLKGMIWNVEDSLGEKLRDDTVPPYSVGRFKDSYWSHEGNFAWQDIPVNTGLYFASTHGQSGHGSPFFVLRNHLNGGYFVCQMGWSANWRTSFFADYRNDSRLPMRVSLDFEVMPVSPSPARLIAPGETIRVPDVHFGLSHADLDAAIQNLHAYLRESVLRTTGDGLQPVIYNQSGYMQPSYKQPHMSEEGLRREIDIAAEIGAELFMIDAGWYGNNGKEGTDWGNTTGDWSAAEELFPNDLFSVFEYARQKGLKCGLWVEIESAGAKSRLAAEHPDWFIVQHGKKVPRILDLSKPQVAEFVESEIVRIVERYGLDMFRLDYNSCTFEGGFNEKDGRMENTLWRHVETIYGIFDRVGRRFPSLQLENCASGGGRTDSGLVSRFTTTWVSDWFRMPRTVRILNGMSMALPPEYVNRSFGAGMDSSYVGNAETQLHVILMGHPTLFGITPSLAEANPSLMAGVKKYVGIYKDFIRPFHRTAKVYHHTPVIPGGEASGWCALEYVSEDRSKAVAVVFRLLHAEGDAYVFKFRGLHKGKAYRVRIEPEGSEFLASGRELCGTGLEIRLDSALTSQMILLDAAVSESV